MKVFALKSCDTCRKALKTLKAAHDGIEVVDIRADGLETSDIAKIVDAVGFEKALNRSSLTWRGLDEPDKRDMDAVKAVRLIEAHPTLMKRPVVTDGERYTVGWKDEAKGVWLDE